jgi:FkbM family methyltransferase
VNITYILRKILINISGYWIYKKTDLPIGVDLKEDLVNKFHINPACIFDVGANYGQTALHYTKAFKDAKIFSFEPVKNSFDILIKNTKGYKNIFCYNFAFGDKKKEVEIFLHEERFSACNSLKFDNRDGNNSAPKEIVRVMTLNDFVKENKIEYIDLLKIDTEGYELEVLKGGENILTQGSVSAIIGEVALSTKNNRNTQLHALVSYLDKFDYYFVGLYDTDIRTYKQGIAFSNALFIKK